jgi:hypothetical protein
VTDTAAIVAPAPVVDSGFSPPEDTVRTTLLALRESGELDAAGDEPAGAAADEGKSKTEAEPAGAPGVDVASLVALAKDGKFAEVLKALGVDADGAKVPSDRFAQLRKMQKANQAKLDARAQQLSQREQQLQAHVQQVLADFEPLSKARQALQDGDIVGALELFAGEDLDKLSEKAMRQKLATNPEEIKLRRKLEQHEREELQRRDQEMRARQEAAQQQAVQRYLSDVKEAFLADSNPIYRLLAEEEPDFPRAVYAIQVRVSNEEHREITAEEAARLLVDQTMPKVRIWAKLFQSTGDENAEHSGQPTRQAANTARTGKSPATRSRNGAAPERAQSAGKPLEQYSEDELLAHFKRQLARDAATERLSSL